MSLAKSDQGQRKKVCKISGFYQEVENGTLQRSIMGELDKRIRSGAPTPNKPMVSLARYPNDFVIGFAIAFPIVFGVFMEV